MGHFLLLLLLIDVAVVNCSVFTVSIRTKEVNIELCFSFVVFIEKS